MSFVRFFTLLILLSFSRLFSQTTKSSSVISESSSNILTSYTSDTVFLKLVVKNAQYDISKNNLPYYSILKITGKNETLRPTLTVNKVQVVKEPHHSVVLKNFEKYLTNKFELINASGISRNEQYNQFQVIPFRINGNRQIEELISYDVTWVGSSDESYSAHKEAGDFKTSSVLASGQWVKIGITQTGIHKINKAFLNNAGINTNNLDPSKIRIFGNGGKMLPERNKDFRYDDLEETAIEVVTEKSNTFGNSDYILFYGTGTTEWVKTNQTLGLKYRAIKNLYSDTSFYFINIGSDNGKRIETKASFQQAANATSSSYDYYNYHEENTINFGKSGRAFYGETFDLTNVYTFSWNDADFVTQDTIIAEVSLVAASKEKSYFPVSGNGLNFAVTAEAINVGALHAPYASDGVRADYGINNNSSEINITISKQTQKSVGYLDKLIVNARRNLNVNARQFVFRDSRVAKLGNICNYVISNAGSANVSLWNVTDPLNPFIQTPQTTGTSINFVAQSNTLNEYCAAPSYDYYTPTFVGKVANQNLHGIAQADYIIVTHPMFLKEAQQLGAFHRQKEGFSYAVATTEQVYNEFSSGRPDVAAIRDFIRMLYEKNIDAGTQVKYALLMGDGSYKNNSRNLVNNSNLIPTYQSNNSLSETESIATDDFFGLMDPNDGYYAENSPGTKIDVGIGRFPCRTNAEVQAILNKIINYYRTDPSFEVTKSTKISYTDASESPMGDWRNWLLFLGDDEDGALHMTQSDGLSRIVTGINPSYNFDKIFLDAFQRTSSPGGYRYPDASEDFIKRIKKGALIFNYTGHGGEVGLTAERMVDLDIINKLDNFNKLPLFITATCEFSRYDDPARTSAGELCLLNPKGGAIGMLTTCRIAYAGPNETLNILLLKHLFNKTASGNRPTLGDVVRLTKAHLGQQYIYANFHLLGDPALTLAYPEGKIVTSGINATAVDTLHLDTLSALSKVTVTGYVANANGVKLHDFNGVVYPTVFDKEQNIVCLANSDDSRVNIGTQNDPIYVPFEFKLQKNILYRGKIQATNGDFSFTFIVPKDISFAPGPGKISYYATNGITDASGYHKQLVVGGTSQNVITDNDGPEVSLFMNDKSFVNGGYTNENPVFYADLTDSTGINTVGTGLGHDISVVLDENASKPVILNDYYEANLNSYQSGRVRYPFEKLSEGEHRLSFKVWDIQNNSSTVYSDFIVAPSAELALEHVLNYPNPFTTHTKFLFQHNQACNPLKVTVQIYTITGKIVKTLQKSVLCEGTVPEGIEWDGKDDFGDKLGRGVYIYKLAILNPENKKAEKIEKLVILN